MLHIRTKTDYESALINIMFPFHWGAFMFYFLLLAFFIPFARQLNGFVYYVSGVGVPPVCNPRQLLDILLGVSGLTAIDRTRCNTVCSATLR